LTGSADRAQDSPDLAAPRTEHPDLPDGATLGRKRKPEVFGSFLRILAVSDHEDDRGRHGRSAG
jgi:hypothetical protein